MSKIDSILFDLDGTLWSSAKAISEAWGLVLQKHEDIEKKEVTEEELYSCMDFRCMTLRQSCFRRFQKMSAIN